MAMMFDLNILTDPAILSELVFQGLVRGAMYALMGIGLSPQRAMGQSPTGAWTLQVDWPGGVATVMLTLTDSAGVQHAHWRGPQGELPTREVRWTREEVAFVVAPEDQRGDAIRLSFRATVSGNELRGELSGRDGQVLVQVTGRR